MVSELFGPAIASISLSGLEINDPTNQYKFIMETHPTNIVSKFLIEVLSKASVLDHCINLFGTIMIKMCPGGFNGCLVFDLHTIALLLLDLLGPVNPLFSLGYTSVSIVLVICLYKASFSLPILLAFRSYLLFTRGALQFFAVPS